MVNVGGDQNSRRGVGFLGIAEDAVLSHEINQHLSSSCQKCLISSPVSVIDVAQESLDTPVQAIDLQAAGNTSPLQCWQSR